MSAKLNSGVINREIILEVLIQVVSYYIVFF